MKEMFFKLFERLLKLFSVKSLITLVCTYVFAKLTDKGLISAAEFLVIFTVIINSYFEVQRNKKE